MMTDVKYIAWKSTVLQSYAMMGTIRDKGKWKRANPDVKKECCLRALEVLATLATVEGDHVAILIIW